jgi:DNA-binding NarL/FixJ family response regulator
MPDDAPLRVMIVDDHPIWREAIESDLRAAGLTVVGVAGDGEQALRRIPAARPDVVVLDLRLPTLDGVETTRRIAAEHPGVRVLVLSASGEEQDVLAAIKAGATGYLVKSASREELLDAVRRTAAGDAVFTPGLAGLVLGEFRRMMSDDSRGEATMGPRLTERETEILRLMAGGYSNKEIANSLGVAEGTVKNHVSNILSKLGVRDRTRAVLKAFELKLV